MAKATRDLRAPSGATILDVRIAALLLSRLVATLRVTESLARDRRDLEVGRFYAITPEGRRALEQARSGR